jgi:hypothetical protein
MTTIRVITLFLVCTIWVGRSEAQAQPASSTLCQFNSGTRAGQTQNYAPMAPIPVGSPCTDGQGSTGVVIPMTGASPPGPGNSRMSTICQFNSGPRTGQKQDYAPMAPIPVGSPCTDGQNSTGVVIPMTGAGPSPGPGNSGMSTICQFNSGPRTGQKQNYAPMAPIPVGSSCTDGQGSNGVVVPGF